MPDRSSWLSRLCCCRRQSQHTYIYLYSPRMGDSSSLFRCLICLIFGAFFVFLLVLTVVVVYHLNSNNISLKANTDQPITPIARKRQLPDFVNLNIDPCEHFYEFVCDKWTRRRKLEGNENEEEYEQKWTRIRHRIHDKLMINISSNPPRSSESMKVSFSYSWILMNHPPLFRYMLEIGINI
jgi:hypothetical protein